MAMARTKAISPRLHRLPQTCQYILQITHQCRDAASC